MSMNLGGWELEIKDMDVVFIFSLLHLAFATVNFATFAAIVAEPFLIQRSAQSTQVGIIVRIELYNSRSHFSVMLCSPGWALGLQCYTWARIRTHDAPSKENNDIVIFKMSIDLA